ncbi:MAG: N-acetyltransferase [Chitinophagia bacterium]|nr:N-acetyltransferase [Chitinophagia bacterium]
MALKIIEHNSEEYRQMVALRDAILRKPLGLSFDQTELNGESNHILIGAFEEEDILGCCMLIEENPQTVRLRQMAVYNEKQGKGIGRALMNFAETLARDRGYKLLTMHARKDAQGFYEKMGYEPLGVFNSFSPTLHSASFWPVVPMYSTLSIREPLGPLIDIFP